MASDNTRGVVFVQPQGAGNTLKFVIGQQARGGMGARGGGGVSGTSLFSQGRYVATEVSSNLNRYTTNLRVDGYSNNALLALDPRCPLNVLLFKGCTPQSVDNFREIEIYVDSLISGQTTTSDLLQGTSGDGGDLMEQIDVSAAVFERCRPLIPANIQGTVTAGAFNHAIAIGGNNCDSSCGGDTSGLEFLAVADPTSPATVSKILYTANGGTSWTQQTIAASAVGTAEAVAVAGSRVVVAMSGTNGGIFYAPLSAVKLGTATFTLANGVTAGDDYADIIALDEMTLVAVGSGNLIAVSKDGGFSFTELTAPADDYTCVAAGSNKSIVWVGGTAVNQLVRITNLNTAEAVAVTAFDGNAPISLAVPFDRPDEVYAGLESGAIFRTRNATDATPTWEELLFDKPSGGGTVPRIAFSGARQCVMWVVQTDGSSDSSVLVDYSGGAMGANTVRVGTFASPANNGFNWLVPTSVNHALVFGEPINSYGYIGRVAAITP